MSRLNKTDLELLQTGQNIDLTSIDYAYLGGEFATNPNDYVEVLIYDKNENFLESAVVDSSDYIIEGAEKIRLKTGTILRKMGYEKGRYIVKYNFLRKVAGSYENILVDANNERHTEAFDPNSEEDRAKIGDTLFIKEYKYYIHEISPSKHEVRLAVDTIKENGNNQRYLRDFYNMQRTFKRVASLGDEDLSIKFVKPDNGQEGDSLELEFVNSGNTFPQEMLGGTINLNKAFVTKIITPEPPAVQGSGTDPFEEIDSDTLVARFAVTNLDQAKIERSGDASLWDLWNTFKGTKMDTSIDALSNISVSTEDGEQVRNIYSLPSNLGTFEFDEGSGGPQTVEISSISSRPDGSTATYVWTVFGYDQDNRWQGSTWKYPAGRRIYWRDAAVVKSGDNEGDFTIRGGGLDGIAVSSKSWTDRDVTNNAGSKIAIEMHSNDLRIGVHLAITNDVGQSDEIVIPAFLTTKR
jgi:hypothetical protein